MGARRARTRTRHGLRSPDYLTFAPLERREWYFTWVLRRLLAFVTLTILLLIILVVGDAPSAWACSCTTKPVMSTFVGRVDSVNGDSFSFVDVVTTSGDAVSNPVVVNILAGRKPDAAGNRRFTSCDIAADQPLVGGVYRVTVNPVSPNVGTCGGSYSLVEAPPVQMTESNRRPTVALALGGVLLVVAAGMAIQVRKQRDA